MYNPKFKQFLKENPDISMLKLSWALYWRLSLILVPASILLAFLMNNFFPEAGNVGL